MCGVEVEPTGLALVQSVSQWGSGDFATRTHIPHDLHPILHVNEAEALARVRDQPAIERLYQRTGQMLGGKKRQFILMTTGMSGQFPSRSCYSRCWG